MAFTLYRDISIDYTKCGSSDSAAFPVLVKLSDATLKSAGNGGHVQHSSGYDIQFFTDSGLTTRIPAEREFYDASNGILIAWVKRDISHSANTHIYMGFGDSGISTDPNSDGTYGATSTWNSAFKGVYHFGNGSLSAADSTGLNNGTIAGAGATAATGKIGGGLQVDRSSTGHITIPDSTTNRIDTGDFTVSTWFNYTSLSYYDALIDKAANSLVYLLGGTSHFFLWIGGSNTYFDTSGFTATTWHHFLWTRTGSTNTTYLDGSVNNASFSAGGTTDSHGDWQIGGNPSGGGANMLGYYDEYRIANAYRSADWTTTEYNNQSSPGNIGSPGFYTVGNETSTGGGGFAAKFRRTLSLLGTRVGSRQGLSYAS